MPPPLDAVLLFVEGERYEDVLGKLIGGDGGGREALGFNEECDVGHLEGGGAGAGTSTAVLAGPKQ